MAHADCLLQVHPVVSRMMEPIEGTDNGQIAECLGLDATAFKQAYSHQVDDAAVSRHPLAHHSCHQDNEDDEFSMLTTQLSDEERFKTAVPLEIVCQDCGYKTNFPGVRRSGQCSLNQPPPPPTLACVPCSRCVRLGVPNQGRHPPLRPPLSQRGLCCCLQPGSAVQSGHAAKPQVHSNVLRGQLDLRYAACLHADPPFADTVNV